MASAKDTRRKETQAHQRMARTVGTVSPRRLARGIAKAMRRAKDQKPSDIRGWRQMVGQLPEKGKKTLRGKA